MKTALHEKAKTLARTYKRSESELLEVLIEMQEKHLFAALKYKGIFDYCLKELELGEAQSSYFNRVAQKSKEVPALKEAIVKGQISLSEGRRIVPVITQENSQIWIEAASTLLPSAGHSRDDSALSGKARPGEESGAGFLEEAPARTPSESGATSDPRFTEASGAPS